MAFRFTERAAQATAEAVRRVLGRGAGGQQLYPKRVHISGETFGSGSGSCVDHFAGVHPSELPGYQSGVRQALIKDENDCWQLMEIAACTVGSGDCGSFCDDDTLLCDCFEN